MSGATSRVRGLTRVRGAGTGRAVRWVTPLGLPVVQPYRKTTSVAVRTVVQVLHTRPLMQQHVP